MVLMCSCFDNVLENSIHDVTVGVYRLTMKQIVITLDRVQFRV